ncbi:hypothetical protein A9K69_19030 [Stenotrophomonas maltophilia]|nr:hypothetical protein A9K69_19030 [Stenotrophomonas maltophilia]
MEIRHLRCFIAVAEELHSARAAERLHIEQSLLSRAIKELEEDLGAQLLAGRTPMLTTYLLRRGNEPSEVLARFIERTSTVAPGDDDAITVLAVRRRRILSDRR